MSNDPQKAKPFPWQKAFSLTKDYFFNSDEKLVAWLYLIGAIICVIGVVAMFVGLSWWSAAFWEIMAAKTLIPFLKSIGNFSLLLTGLVGFNVLRDYFIGKVSILWRNWLTKKILDDLFKSKNNYLDLHRFPKEIENLPQRIQEDVRSFVDLTLRLGLDGIGAALSLTTFIGTLWVVGGSLSFALAGLNIVIPGYMVWLALIFSTVTTLITLAIGKSLTETNKASERAEADFRQSLVELHEKAEDVAVTHAEKYYQSDFDNRLATLKNTAGQKVDTQIKLVGFQNFYNQLSQVLPTLLSAPLYFAGLIELGQVMQISMSFGQVSFSFSWFANSYEPISNYRSSVERLSELQNALEADRITSAGAKNIVMQEGEEDSISLNVSFKGAEQSSAYIMRNLNLKFKRGEHVLIRGPSGIGKSMLFKLIARTWMHGEGEGSIPANNRFCFLPTQPILPFNTLKAVLAYPDKADQYTDQECMDALRKVGGLDDFISRLNEVELWSSRLSTGQKQRISFVRALLKKPDWLFMDETTSALPVSGKEHGEEHLYDLVKQMKGTTIISIAHRESVEKYHDRILFFSVNKDKELSITEQRNSELNALIECGLGGS